MLSVAAVALAADQVTKTIVIAAGPGARAPGDLVSLELVRNRGAAFGVAPTLTPLFAGLATIAVAICLYYGLRSRSTGLSIGLGLVAGGAAGNLTDRLTRAPGPFRGAVVDWIKVAFYRPAFNLADVALRAGVAALIVYALRGALRGHPQEAQTISPGHGHTTDGT